MNDEVSQRIAQIARERPDLVVEYEPMAVASAWLQGLVADHISRVAGGGASDRRNTGRQDHAVLLVELDEVGSPTENIRTTSARTPDNPLVDSRAPQKQYLAQQGGPTAIRKSISYLQNVTVILSARVVEVVSLAEGQTDCTGWPITLTLRMPDWSSLEALELEVGGRYLVTGQDYFDNTNIIGQHIVSQAASMGYAIGEYDKSKLVAMTPEYVELWKQGNPRQVVPYAYYGDLKYMTEGIPRVNGKIDKSKAWLLTDSGDPELMPFLHTAKMTVSNPAAEIKYNYADMTPSPIRYSKRGDESISWHAEEFSQRFGNPVIAKVEGSLADFLAQNSQWREYLQVQDVNIHSFLFCGVNKLNTVPDFNRGTVRITQGRDFTKEELADGAKVCLISETLAAINGLQVGDTLQPQFYSTDSVTFNSVTTQESLVGYQAVPGRFMSQEDFWGEAEVYTIVGLYRHQLEWEERDINAHAFTPNTVFVPKASLDSRAQRPNTQQFSVLWLQNGKQQEFDELLVAEPFDTLPQELMGDREGFVYMDQGYLTVRDALESYEGMSVRVTAVGCVLYLVLILLVLYFYVGRFGKTLYTMATLGAPRHKRMGHLLLNGLVVLVPGTVVGTGLSWVLWNPLIGALLKRQGSSLNLSPDLSFLAAVAVAQLALAAAVLLVLSWVLSKQGNLMKKR